MPESIELEKLLRTHGDKNVAKRLAATSRLMPNGCIEWTSYRNEDNYGRTSYSGRLWIVSRLVYTLIHGEIDRSLSVCHRCDNPPCMNPAHLFLGSHVANIHDSVEKGRMGAPGKLTPEQVAEALASPENNTAIARRFGVRQDLISRIRRGRRYQRWGCGDTGERITRGESQHLAKLTDEQVRAIRRDQRTQTAIGREYGVAHSAIGRIKRGETWTHVT